MSLAPKPLFRDPVYDGAADPVVIWNRVERCWFMFYTNRRATMTGLPGVSWVYGTRIGIAASSDGANWTYRGVASIAYGDADDAHWAPDVFFEGGRYHMFFCYRYSTGYRGRERGYRIGYAASDDLETWARDDARAGIDVSDEGWDSEMVSYPHVFELDGRVRMLYLGNQVGRGGFGLAELEGDLA